MLGFCFQKFVNNSHQCLASFRPELVTLCCTKSYFFSDIDIAFRPKCPCVHLCHVINLNTRTTSVIREVHAKNGISFKSTYLLLNSLMVNGSCRKKKSTFSSKTLCSVSKLTSFAGCWLVLSCCDHGTNFGTAQFDRHKIM